MANVDFEKLNEIVVQVLGYNNTDEKKLFEKVGEIYFHARESNVKLIVPKFSGEKIVEKAINYLSCLFSLFEFVESDRLNEFDGCYLFNYLSNKKYIYLSDCELSYCNKSNDVLKWGENCFTLTDEFLPVFKKRLTSCSQIDEIYTAFPLFAAIRKNELIKYPVLITLDKKHLLLTNSNSLINPINYLNIQHIEYDSNQDSSKTKQQHSLIQNSNFSSQFIVKFPYYRSIDSRLTRIVSKSFEIEFRRRFYIPNIDSIDEREIYLLPLEINSTSQANPIVNIIDFITIVETEHTFEERNLIAQLRREWKAMNFNIYTHPFPKYFFMFVNPSLKKSEWMSLFERSFPLVKDTSIYNNVEKVVEFLVEKDWVKNIEFTESMNFVFPDLSNNKNRSKRLLKPYESFKGYCSEINSNITFSVRPEENKENIILNLFDILEVVNYFQNPDYKYLIICPDYLYYNYNPFVPVNVYDFQSKVFLTNAKSNLNFGPNETDISHERARVMKDIYHEISDYQIKHKKDLLNISEIEEKDANELMDESYINEDEESLSLQDIQVDESSSCKVVCELINGETKEFDGNDNVYIKRHNYLNIKALNIMKSDFILNHNILLDELEFNNILARLEIIPDSVKEFKRELSKIDNPFEELKTLGLKIDTKDYFLKSYVSEADNFDAANFKLPRMHDWEIVCKLLQIDFVDMNLAYVARYKDKGKIKRIYKELLDNLIKKNLLASLNSNETRNVIFEIFSEHKKYFEKEEEDFDLDSIINSAVYNVVNQIDNYLKEVKSVSKNLKS